jgi:FkbM family methyltransferase
MKFAKRIFYKFLNQATYLKLLHSAFFFLYDTGLLKKSETYKFHYFVKRIIKEGDYVVDIGANLGYFSKIFIRLAGKKGKVICIEPIKPFFNTLRWALKKKTNCVLYNYAFGTEKKCTQMILPKTDGYLRTGLAHISSNGYDKNDVYSFNVEVIKGSYILNELLKINYIKCDIEGYEEYVLPELVAIIKKHKPILQVETWGVHKEIVFNFMKKLGYTRYGLSKRKLIKNLSDDYEFLFVHKSSEKSFLNKNIF